MLSLSMREQLIEMIQKSENKSSLLKLIGEVNE
jgi:hypothetical protein